MVVGETVVVDVLS